MLKVFGHQWGSTMAECKEGCVPMKDADTLLGVIFPSYGIWFHDFSSRDKFTGDLML